jgi:outer membrane protein assembly factor BamE (lipoprotein component of BamABCDE complex)
MKKLLVILLTIVLATATLTACGESDPETAPDFDLPDFDLPDFELPDFDLDDFDLSDFDYYELDDEIRRADYVNAENFAFLRLGMSVDEVLAIISVEPNIEVRNEIRNVQTVSFTWYCDRFYNEIGVSFADDSMHHFYQHRLESVEAGHIATVSGGGVNDETFSVIRNGMSIAEVLEIIGEAPDDENTVETIIGVFTYKWWSDGDITMNVDFADDLVTNTRISTTWTIS